MTSAASPDPTAAGPRGRSGIRRIGWVIGVVISGTVLVVLNLATTYFAVAAWLVTPEADYDQDRLAAAGASVLLCIGLAMVTALLTVFPVLAGWLGKRWLLLPAALFTIALARGIALEITYSDLPDNYGFSQIQSVMSSTSYSPVATGQSPSVVDGMQGYLPSGPFQTSDALNAAFKEGRWWAQAHLDPLANQLVLVATGT